MRKIILATLTSGLLLGETHIVFAECQTVAQVRAANPNSYLSYHLVAGARCWYVGSPHHRDVPAAEKPKLQSAISSNDDKPDGALLNEKPIDFRNAYELDTVAPPAGHAPYGERISGTFNVIGVDASSIESNESKTERLDEIRAVIYGPQPAPPPGQRGLPVSSAIRYLKLLTWLLLTIGVGSISIGVLDIYRDRVNAPGQVHAESWLDGPRLRVRDYPSGRTPLVKFIAYLEPDGPSRGLWRNARDHMALTSRSLSGWLLRTG